MIEIYKHIFPGDVADFPPPPAPARTERFVCRFAVGAPDENRSSAWRVWTAKNQPDVYLAARALVEKMKATVHCPRESRPTFKRHAGFTSEAMKGVNAVKLPPGRPRHIVQWRGAELAPSFTLEWRILIPRFALRPFEAAGNNAEAMWIPAPTDGHMVEIDIILGPQAETVGWPGKSALGTKLLAEGRLYDRRRLWVVYHYVVDDVAKRMMAEELHKLRTRGVRAPQNMPGLRLLLMGLEEDGSMNFCELPGDALPTTE